MFAFVDETGNTGRNLLDETQPDFFTAALITRTNFDLVYPDAVRRIAKSLGAEALHAKDIGLARMESIAPGLRRLFKKADARFFVSRVEKRYLLATKLFDALFDSGENAAVAWHNYNLRPLKVMFAFKVAMLVTEGIGQRFWDCLLEKNETKAKAGLPGICQSLLDRIDILPDQRSREVITAGLEWARDHPDAIHMHLDTNQARKGHMPNLVAFANLLEGLEGFSKRWARPVKRITHDRQSEFENTLKEWHELYTTASPEPINWAGETYVVQRVVGSSFEMKADGDSAGIQAVDVVLWLYLQFTRKAKIPYECARLLNYVFKKTYHSDFSFDGVHDAIEKRWGGVLRGSLTDEEEARAKEILDLSEKRRLESMAQYEKDGIVPFMRDAAIAHSLDVATPSSE
jgi:hypothetical protein